MTDLDDPLARFSPPARAWFSGCLGRPTPVQAEAWAHIERGENALVIAPTGSGKTLATFLWAVDSLMRPGQAREGVRVLYVSPLKALGVDVERNLRAPLEGISGMALDQGICLDPVSVGVRSGDTPPTERRRLAAHPPQILITTPESLFLMLSSGAAATLTGIDTVIVDEIHYLAGTKRGAHLAVSLERLEAMNTHGPIQRIGLSATVRPARQVAAFLAGTGREVTVVEPAQDKRFVIDVRVPVEDMTHTSSAAPSMWTHVEKAVLDLIMAHRSTICFCNSRGVAERLTNRLNLLYAEAAPDEAEPVIARTHHGSISKVLRAQIEADLKAGRLRCVVATSSLELGIDMGAVDLVVHVGAPPSVASGLQRIGRGGHQVEAISRGVIFPLSRSDLLATAAVTRLMADQDIEESHRIRNPLDVLAQQILSMCLDGPVPLRTLLRVARGADCFADLPERAFVEVVDMLTGKYPSVDFEQLRPRLIWDREADTLVARPGTRRLVTTSGGTIPDRGLYGVFITGTQSTGSSKHAVSRRVGELDEEMVNESRVGDVFTLGTTAWRIDRIDANQVLVTPAPGQTGRMPFWRGDQLSRSVTVGRQIQRLVAAMETCVDDCPTASGVLPAHEEAFGRSGLDEWATRNLVSYVADQRTATRVVPDGGAILVEANRDEVGAWRVCVHAALGRGVLQPWAIAVQHRLREEAPGGTGEDLRVFVTDDGIVFRLGEVDDPRIGRLLGIDPDQIDAIVARQMWTTSMFAARFRQCAARALLLPRRDPGKRSPLWQQRLRSAQLLGVASNYPDFPIIAEAMRECLDDVFDMESLRGLMRDIASGRTRVVEVTTPTPSPFASAVLFGYTGAFLYDDDQPLAERAAVASQVDPALLASLVGAGAGAGLDVDALAEIEDILQRRSRGHRASSEEAVWDLLRSLGPLTREEVVRRSAQDPASWVSRLVETGRVVEVLVAGVAMLAVSDDRPLLDSMATPASVRRLTSRWVRHHGVVTVDQICGRYGVDPDQVRMSLEALVDAGQVEKGRFLGDGEHGYIWSETAARVRRRAVMALRAKVQPVEQSRFASFLARWMDLDRPGRGAEALMAAVEQLAGYPLPASMLESVILPGRVLDYEPGMLDQAMLSSQVTWTGQGSIGSADGWICLWPADMAPVTPPPDLASLTHHAQQVYSRLAGGGAWTAADLAGDDMDAAQALTAVWELVWAGLVSSDTLVPVRDRSRGAGALRRPHTPSPRRVVRRVTSWPTTSRARWFAVPDDPRPATVRLVDAVALELTRYGILTRGSILSEAMTPTFMDAYRVLTAMEGQAQVRRGYFVDGLGGAQFAVPGAVDRLRDQADAGMTVVAACDPANPWGAAMVWPASQGHRPSRSPGALVVLDDGSPVVYLERGSHTVVSFGADMEAVGSALAMLGDWVDRRRLDTITITRINQDPALHARSWTPALEAAGFTMIPQGFRRRGRINSP
ncbi:MAG: DEAD/DEAH box helicase [Propionibacteriaceae bacterium]|nr:DEAD/DEAH box helicase [Propionibacteriaceae bacterium]